MLEVTQVEIPETLIIEQAREKFAIMMTEFKDQGQPDEQIQKMITKEVRLTESRFCFSMFPFVFVGVLVDVLVFDLVVNARFVFLVMSRRGPVFVFLPCFALFPLKKLIFMVVLMVVLLVLNTLTLEGFFDVRN